MEYFTGTVSNGINTFSLTNQIIPTYILQNANLENYSGSVNGNYEFDGQQWYVHGTITN